MCIGRRKVQGNGKSYKEGVCTTGERKNWKKGLFLGGERGGCVVGVDCAGGEIRMLS